MRYNLFKGNKMNFFQELFASLFGGNNPEAEKQRLLKMIAKDLSKTKPRFYKVSSHQIEPSFAKFFYEIYKIISPAQIMFQNTTPAALKNAVTNYYLTDRQHELLEQFTEANIETLSRTVPTPQLKKQMSALLKEFEDGFTTTRESVNQTYNKLFAFKNFCLFDFYFMLHKFDSSLRERNFNMIPRFVPINGTYIAEDLKNFLEIAYAVPFDEDWSEMIQVLKAFKGVEPITLNSWKKICARLKTLQSSGVLEMMVQVITEEPTYKEKINYPDEKIIEGFISSIKKQVNEKLDQLKKTETTSKVESILDQLFNERNIDRLPNYNEHTSEQFERKSLGKYIYSEPLCYLNKFIHNYIDTDLRTLSDLLIIRGKWAEQGLSSQMSNAFNNLLELKPKIHDFDTKLSEENEIGRKMKTLLPRSEHDKMKDKNIIAILIRDINSEAAEFLTEATTSLIDYAKCLKLVLEDSVKSRPELLVNWTEINKFAEHDIRNMGITAYKKIYMFVQLLQAFPIVDED